ncbi:hypothetical protein CPB84DRAFT_1761523 [Gymnopilus junonius]|uniref:Uncharacterized protein n=1 Tax=Gymnopilus junonius TaxID=109634 RepID=A0A9P5P1L8_GYMJU|nr:hypothetical protein CPB84DRAFT_1761523 [Gymnopilus junonius]
MSEPLFPAGRYCFVCQWSRSSMIVMVLSKEVSYAHTRCPPAFWGRLDIFHNICLSTAGLVPKSNVHAIPHGAKVHQTPTEVQIIGANSTVLYSVPFDKTAKAAVSPFKKQANSTLAPNVLCPMDTSLMRIGKIQAHSPSVCFPLLDGTIRPANTDGQLLYWFNALVPPSDDAILQPVLQYGVSPAGGGPYYSIASWYLINSNVYFSDLIQVQPGQELTGYMVLVSTTTSGSTTEYVWAVYFGGYRGTIITIQTTEQLNWAYEALEIYGTQSTADLPSGNTDMSGISVTYENNESPSSLSWTTISDPTDEISMSILSSSSTNGAVRITY